jgi:hypothetical protein
MEAFMKKLITLALAIALLGALVLPLAADDGSVLPAGVFRARVIPVYA